MDEARALLTEEMNARRKHLRLRWTEVARRAGMSPQNLLRIRTGAIALTDFATVGLEQALEWQSGYIDAFLATEDHASQLGADATEPGSARLDAAREALIEAVAVYIDEYGEEGAIQKLREDAPGLTPRKRPRASGD